MAHMTPAQIANRDRIESLIALAAPFLDLVLAAGDRISRTVEPVDEEHYPIRAGGPVALPGEPGYDGDAGLPQPEQPGPAGGDGR
ncbi:MAG TPA: hypothetical protein VFH44_02335 [Solirubrobacterales bacterium]|nr:hypothetical protein [Solirubrobacterales bacterium]